MATNWNDLKHKASPDKRDRLERVALAELDTLERSGMGILRSKRHQSQVDVSIWSRG